LIPVYRDLKKHIIRTWRENAEDEELRWPQPIEQIETDPSDRNLIYVLTWQGLYRSQDQGKLFRLLPLEIDKALSIDAIAVDPLTATTFMLR